MNESLYRNAKIVFEESANPKILIDDEPVHVSCDADAKEFNAAELPYRSFGSVEAVARAIVEHRRRQAE